MLTVFTKEELYEDAQTRHCMEYGRPRGGRRVGPRGGEALAPEDPARL